MWGRVQGRVAKESPCLHAHTLTLNSPLESLQKELQSASSQSRSWSKLLSTDPPFSPSRSPETTHITVGIVARWVGSVVVCWCLSVLVLVLVGRCVACTPTHASVFATQSNMGCNCNAFNLSSKKLGMNKDDDSYNQNTAISHGRPGCRHAHTPSQLTQSRSRTR